MHGMLSAAVMLAVFAVIALVSGASAGWLFRAAGATPGRSRPVRPPGIATGRDHEAAGPPGEPTGESDGTEADYPDRTWLGPALTATASLTGPAEHDRWTGPGDAAGPPDAGDVYDVDDWAAAGDSGDGRGGPNGPTGSGHSSPGPRGWPDTAKSLYSRGWPVMDSPPREPDAEQPAIGTNSGADAGVAGQPDAAQEQVAEVEPAARPEGARVYILGESRRPGR